ncbi:hypothetical protein BH20ACT24_BH20ACT24_06670 [soil metagenome]
MKRWLARLTVALSVFALMSPAPVSSQEQPVPLDPNGQDVLSRVRAAGRGTDSPIRLRNFELVGHHDLGGEPFDFGDVWGHESFAYVGTRCGEDLSGGHGVRVVDISDPSNPVLGSALPNPAFTRAEDVVVHDVSTPSFSGDLAAVGIQDCFGSGHENEAFTGMIFFDVTDGYNPVELGRWALPPHAIGCHEIDLVQRTDGMVLAGCAHNLFDQFRRGPRAVQFVDVTDPAEPQTLSGWSLGTDVFRGVGCADISFAHSVRFTNRGREAKVSNWDAGLVTLDISDPTSPTYETRIDIAPPDEDGDVHSMTPANRGQWQIINTEDFCVGGDFNGWGEAYVYSAEGRFLTTFSTPNSDSSRTDGAYTIHNTEVVLENQFFSSWYSDGIVWWDFANGVAHQKGQFVPPSATEEPPLVWGVYPDRGQDVILASDIISGLWIVRPEGLGDF